jgi:hypothetical protein
MIFAKASFWRVHRWTLILVSLGCKASQSNQSDSQIAAAVSKPCLVTQVESTPDSWSLTSSSLRIFLLGDLFGNLNGIFEPSELLHLSERISKMPDDAFSCNRALLLTIIAQKKADGDRVTRELPNIQRQMALLSPAEREMSIRIDLEWGDADGSAQVSEIETAREFYSRLSDIFPVEDSSIQSLLGKKITRTISKPEGKRALAAKLLNSAMDRSLYAAPWLITRPVYHAPNWHQFSVLEHLARAKVLMENLLNKLSISWDDGPVLMALHDIGKISDRTWIGAAGDTQSGFYFEPHPEVGASILKEADWPLAAFLIENHDAIRKKTVEEILAIPADKLTRQYLALVFAADNLAKGSTPMLDKELREELIPKLLAVFEGVGLNQSALKQFIIENGYPH